MFRTLLPSRIGVSRIAYSVPKRQLYPFIQVKGMATGSGHLNRLATAKSPYLRQHATNPVDWYPFEKAALDKARAENKVHNR
jgi:hypothetical protein